MLGFFGSFGRSQELRRLDQAVRAVGLHPLLVPEAVKFATLNLLREVSAVSDQRPYTTVAELLGYCVLGAQGFTECNDLGLTEAVEARLATALEAGDSLDARVVLLTLHAGVIQPGVCQWRSKKGPPRRCKKGPLGGCGLVPVVHGRAPRATRRALNRLTRRRAREGPVGPRGQAWAGWSVQLAVGV